MHHDVLVLLWLLQLMKDRKYRWLHARSAQMVRRCCGDRHYLVASASTHTHVNMPLCLLTAQVRLAFRRHVREREALDLVKSISAMHWRTSERRGDKAEQAASRAEQRDDDDDDDGGGAGGGGGGGAENGPSVDGGTVPSVEYASANCSSSRHASSSRLPMGSRSADGGHSAKGS